MINNRKRRFLKTVIGLSATSLSLSDQVFAKPFLSPVIGLLLDDECTVANPSPTTILSSSFLGSQTVQRVGFRDYFNPVSYNSGDSGSVTCFVERLLSARGILRVRVYTEHGMNVQTSDYQAFDQVITMNEGQWYGAFEITINAHDRIGTGEILLRMEIINSLQSLNTTLDHPNADWAGIYLFDRKNKVPPGTVYVSNSTEFLNALNGSANYIGLTSSFEQPSQTMSGGGTSLQNRKVIFGANASSHSYDSSIRLSDGAGTSRYTGKYISFESLQVEKIAQVDDPINNADLYALNLINVTGLRAVYTLGANSAPVFMTKKGGRVFNCDLDTHISSVGNFQNAGAIHGYNYSETVIEGCNLSGQLYHKASLSAAEKSLTVKRCTIVPPTGVNAIQIESAANNKSHNKVLIDRVTAASNITLGSLALPESGGTPHLAEGGDYEIKNTVCGGAIEPAWKSGYSIYNNLAVGPKQFWRFFFTDASNHGFYSAFNVIDSSKSQIATNARYAAIYNTGFTTKDFDTLAELQEDGFETGSIVLDDFGVADASNSDWFQRNYTPEPDSPLQANVGHDGYQRGVVHPVGQRRTGFTHPVNFPRLTAQNCSK